MSFEFPPGFLEHLNPLKKFDAGAFEHAHSLAPPTSIRLHPVKGNSAFEEYPHVDWCKAGRYLPERPEFILDPLFHAGAYYVQEAASMSLDAILREFIHPVNQPVILDLCASPGGKSTLISSFLEENGILVSNEVIKPRTASLKENSDRWGYPNTVVSSNDPRQFGRMPDFFDAIVVDAPCSGSGMFRKDPQAKSHWTLDAVEQCAARQKRILTDIWPALKPGGILIYSTCSYSVQENEEIAQWLCATYDAVSMEVTTFRQFPEILSEGIGYRFYPHTSNSEGLFISVFQKKGIPTSFEFKHAKQIAVPDIVRRFINTANNYVLHQNHLGDSVITKELQPYLFILEKHLHILKSGIKIGEAKGKTFIPDHQLALSTILHGEVPRIELNLQESLRFLKKEAISNPESFMGWHVITYKGLGLGWGNALSNRINNGLPKSWRILKDIG